MSKLFRVRSSVRLEASMKKFMVLFLLVFLIAGCSGNKDELAAYRHLSAAEIFHHADSSLAKGKYADAVKGFEALDAIYPFGPYSQQGQLDIIYAYYKNDDDPSAIAAADRYVRLYPRGKNVAYAYYMKGIISSTEGYTWLQNMVGTDPSKRDLTSQKQAFLAFNEIVMLYPRSPYAGAALVRMRYLRNVIAEHSLRVAEFYYEHKAYVASANRASFVVQHFNGTPAVSDALAMMVKSYRKLGLGKLEHNSYLILQASYPNSKAFKRVRQKA